MKYRKVLGDSGENFAAEVLRNLGYTIMATRFRTRMGEIDIIARQGSCYHFIEVKTRIGCGYGRPSEAVDPLKRERIRRSAEFYMLRNHLEGMQMQFDVIEVEVGLLMGCF